LALGLALTCGAKGTRTPGLLDANHIFCVFLRRPVSPDEASTWGDRRRVSVGVTTEPDSVGSLFGSFGPSFWLGGRTRGARGSTLTASPQVLRTVFSCGSAVRKPQFRPQFCLHWLLPGSPLRPSSWRLQTPLEHGRPAWASRHVAESSRSWKSRRRAPTLTLQAAADQQGSSGRATRCCAVRSSSTLQVSCSRPPRRGRSGVAPVGAGASGRSSPIPSPSPNT
jgi:hypothetical protein